MQLASPQPVVHWEATQAALGAAVRRANELGVRVNIAVTDSGGNLAGFLRMPGAFLHSIHIAIDKAYTSAGFGLPTGALGEGLKMEAEAVRDGLLRRPRLAAFGGGRPLRVNGELIGAIGVSGASEEQDDQCARAGQAAIGATD